ncbi:MAG: hypothetical protein MUD15_13250, partial [Desulfobacterota bacterium]|nr:hypothetical protein [Thermodesulfobacteriota bacterium]
MKPRYLGAVIVFLLLSASFAHAEDTGLTRVFNMPRYEAEQIIKDWLMKGGYEASSDTAAGKVVIRAVKQGSLWEITLRHRSPLATEVTSGETTMGRADTLWRFLADYQEGSISARGFPAGDMPMPVRN